MANPDDTDPSFRTRLERARASTDPAIDRALLWLVESRWTPAILAVTALALTSFGVWVGMALAAL